MNLEKITMFSEIDKFSRLFSTNYACVLIPCIFKDTFSILIYYKLLEVLINWNEQR